MANIVVETLTDGARAVRDGFINNTRTISNALILFGPIVFLVVGAALVQFTDGNAQDWQTAIAYLAGLAWSGLAFFFRGLANRAGKGEFIPTAKQRFTNVQQDGQVDVPYERLQEMILFVADVEDWAERKGYAQWKL